MTDLRIHTERIKARAISLGFSIVGITDAKPLADYHRFTDWLKRGNHAGMRYLTSSLHFDTRRDPRLLMPNVESIIVVGLSYSLHSFEYLDPSTTSLISGYVADKDYHSRIPKMLAKFDEFLTEEYSKEITSKVFTDSAPILEREIGSRAGLGWIGRNSCLISPAVGSSFLLAEIFIDQPLIFDLPFTQDRCGKCDRCVQACPTGCIQEDRTIDSNRCLSYHSIENHEEIPSEIMEVFGNWVFGCDVCQMVCPWNSKAITMDTRIENELTLNKDQLIQLLNISDEQFDRKFGNSALSRVKRKGFVRNVLVRLGNLKDPETLEVLQKFSNSADDPILLETTDWAINQIQNKKRSLR